jgi:hypothetical protein
MSTLASETLTEALADLYDTVRPGTPAAAHFRASAVHEAVGNAADADGVADEVRAVLHGIGEPSTRAKHGTAPCRKHVECLAADIEAALTRCDV